MINVKKKERKKEKRVDRRDIFARSFSFLWAETTREFGLFFFFGQQQEQGKNDSFLEGALLSRRRLNENAYYILHVFVAPGKERTKEIANEKKRTKKKKKNDHICVHSNGVYDCFVALVKNYYYYALLLEHQRKNNKESHFFARTRLPLFFFSLLSRRDAITSSRSGRL